MIHKSIIFAAEAHNGQLRKGTQLPYIIHPMEVAQILSYIHAPQEAIIAGILHDVLEDTEVTYQDLIFQFGGEVAALVSECSNVSCGPWRVRKQHTIMKLQTTKNQNAALILCADKISNLRSIAYDINVVDQEIFGRFSAPKEDVLWYYEQLGKVISDKPNLPACLVQEYVTLLRNLQEILKSGKASLL